MAVFCAVCDQTMGAGDAFAIRGQYVIHRRCLGGQVRTEAYLEKIRHQVAELDLAVAKERQSHQAEIRDLAEKLRIAKLERTVAEGDAERTRQLLAIERHQTALLEAENIRLQLQRQVVSPPALPVASEGIAPAEKNDTPDDTVQRFRLLEFD